MTLDKVKIGIIDYGAGNLRSVQKAFEKVGAGAIVSDSAETLGECDGLVLPGVGAFEEGMRRLREKKLDEFLVANAGRRPLLGICLGLQLLFENSEETFSGAEKAKGLGLLKGRVVKFKEAGLKVPQVGWNQLEADEDSLLFGGMGRDKWAYFVHSYYAVPSERGIVAARTEYGETKFASAVEDRRQKIFACQFHPEKSGKTGLEILGNFAEICGEEK